MEASTSKEYGDFAKSLEDELMNFTTDSGETDVDTYFVERDETRNPDKEGNVVEQRSDSTECSSSFDGLDCGDEGVDAPEVSSGSRGGDGSAFDLNGPDNLFNKRKKVSPDWREFIHPLVWRCKWVELQIKKLEGQARKYDRELEGYGEKSTSEGHGIGPLTSPQNNCTSQMMRRKKRQRGEATDVAAYMSRHNLFSYYEHLRYIRATPRRVPTNHVHNQTVDDHDVELGNDEGEGDDEFLENVLRKINAIQSRVRSLKNRSEKVMAEERVKLHISDHLSSSPSTPSYRTPVGNCIASQLLAEYNLGAVLLPSNDEVEVAAPQANGTLHNPHLEYDYEYVQEEEEDVLMDNQWVREELRYLEKVKFDSMKRPQPPPPPPPPPPPLPPPRSHSASNLTNSSVTKRRKPY